MKRQTARRISLTIAAAVVALVALPFAASTAQAGEGCGPMAKAECDRDKMATDASKTEPSGSAKACCLQAQAGGETCAMCAAKKTVSEAAPSLHPQRTDRTTARFVAPQHISRGTDDFGAPGHVFVGRHTSHWRVTYDRQQRYADRGGDSPRYAVHTPTLRAGAEDCGPLPVTRVAAPVGSETERPRTASVMP